MARRFAWLAAALLVLAVLAGRAAGEFKDIEDPIVLKHDQRRKANMGSADSSTYNRRFSRFKYISHDDRDMKFCFIGADGECITSWNRFESHTETTSNQGVTGYELECHGGSTDCDGQLFFYIIECGACDEGQYRSDTCKAGSAYDARDRTCESCPEGLWCDGINKAFCPKHTEPTPDKSGCQPCKPGYVRYSEASTDLCVPCPAGTYQSTSGGERVCLPCSKAALEISEPGSTKCKTCESVGPYGGILYPNEDSTECSYCVPGYAKTGVNREGLPICTMCPKGTYSGKRALTCTPCPTGYWSNQKFTNCPWCAVGYEMVAGNCLKCAAGTYNDKDGTECDPCPVGSHSDVGATECKACPAGRYGSGYQGSAEHCKPCEPGTFSLGNTGACTPCAEGMWSTRESSYCNTCGLGFGNYDDSVFPPTCERCPDGTSSAAGEKECSACPDGHWSSDGSEVCDLCTPGYYDAGGKLGEQCKKCPNGTYTNSIGNDSCELCKLGTWSGEGFTECIACPAGWYGSGEQTWSTYCKPCKEGTFTTGGVHGVCQDCEPGTWSRSSSTACTACLPGQYGTGSQRSADYCRMCEAGTFAAGYGQVSCTQCEDGLLSEAGSMDCSSCRAGFFDANGGSTANGTELYRPRCEMCQPGTFALQGSLICAPCDPGSWAAAGSEKCTACPAGTVGHGPATDSSYCKQCPSGFVSKEKATSCTQCPRELWPSVDGSECSRCAAGFRKVENAGSDLVICERCPDGQVSPRGKDTCTVCPAGTFADVESTRGGVEVCTPCPAGWYQDEAGQTTCKVCALVTDERSTECEKSSFKLNKETLPIVIPGAVAGFMFGTTGLLMVWRRKHVQRKKQVVRVVNPKAEVVDDLL